MDTMMSSVCNALDGEQIHISQEALIQPVRDMGHSESLRGHFRGTQPFEKGLGFPHRVPELRGWDDMHLKGQVRALLMTLLLCDFNWSLTQTFGSPRLPTEYRFFSEGWCFKFHFCGLFIRSTLNKFFIFICSFGLYTVCMN